MSAVVDTGDDGNSSAFRVALSLLLPLPGDVSAEDLQAATSVATSGGTATALVGAAPGDMLLRAGTQEDNVACLEAYAGQADAALGKWERVVNNIIAHPADPKYRALKHTAPSFSTLAGPGRPLAHHQLGGNTVSVTMGKISREEAVVRVAGILCDALGFVGAANDADVLELPSSFGSDDGADDFAVESNRRRLRQQAALLEEALVTILDIRAQMAQQRALLAEALQATRLAREREQARDARLHELSLLQSSLTSANESASSPNRADVQRFVALLRQEGLAKVASTYDKEVAVEHVRSMARAVGTRSAADPLWAHSSVPHPTVHVLQWAVARLGGDGGSGVASLSLRVRRTLDVTPDASSLPGTTASVSLHAVAAGRPADPGLCAFAADVAEELSAVANELWAAQHAKTASSTTSKLRRPPPSASNAPHTTAHEQQARAAAAAAQRERDVVATNVMGDIAAVLEEEWHLDGAVGYRAPHRLEARRLHAAYSAKEVTLQQLHDALEGHSARLKAKREAAAREKKGPPAA